ncbi:MBL fold metallo-hydrolase [Methylobacterium radiotolerans]
MLGARHLNPDTLLALPVKGESFLFRRAGRAVLIDGGYKEDRISYMLRRHAGDLKRLDVVLCTHGDSDHAGGLPNLLDEWKNRVDQLWLPGRWVDVIPDLARDPVKFLKKLIGELDDALKDPTEEVLRAIHDVDDDEPQKGLDDIRSDPPDRDEAAIDDPFDDTYGDLGPEEPPAEPDWFKDLRHAREQLAGDENAAQAFNAAKRKARRRHKQATTDVRALIARYWLGLIKTAEAIRGIAMAAIRHGIRTRWFDFEEFVKTRRPVGGAPRFLVPVNAVEQAPPPTGLFLYMRLSLINKQSLAFFAPPARARLGFLFCGDSPLGDGRLFSRSFLTSLPKPFWPVVATAPHHGSESNRAAYAHLDAWAEVVVLLRAGGSVDQPGPTFLDQDESLRLCTKCPRARHAPMLSGVLVRRPWWVVHTVGRICECRNPTAPHAAV